MKKAPKKLAYPTEWNLGMFYKSHDDPRIEVDVQNLEAANEVFEKKYKPQGGTVPAYLTDETALLAALIDWENLCMVGAGFKPAFYLGMVREINSADTVAEAKSTALSARLAKTGNRTVFFPLMLGKITPEAQARFLKSQKLARFHYYLKHIFDTSKYDLSEAEEKILNLKSLPSYSLWVDGQAKLLAAQTVKLAGKTIPIADAINKIPSLPMKTRHKLWADVRTKLKSIGSFSEAEMNAICTDKKINDELRGLKEPYTATLLGYQNDEATVLNLVNTTTKAFPVAHRFHKLKAKLLKVPKLEFSDRGADVGKVSRKVKFDEAVRITTNAFAKVGPQYVEIFERFLRNGQIDVFPRKGKRGGGFCTCGTVLPSFILLNHSDTMDGVMTLAHEMGHAIHSELSNANQPILSRGFSTSVAETASTLFENFAFEEVFATLTEKEKIIALHDRINDAIMTVFTQVACFNFELALHRAIREKGALSGEEIAKLLNKEMAAYLGPSVKMHPDDGYRYVWWVHIRYFFYTYTYAYGFLISRALYQRYRQDKSYLKKIEQFLSAGSSKSPEDIFKNIGIDVTRPEFFADGIRAIEDDIARLEKLAKGAGMIK